MTKTIIEQVMNECEGCKQAERKVKKALRLCKKRLEEKHLITGDIVGGILLTTLEWNRFWKREGIE